MFALFLIRERALGDESKWAPYIRVLPRHLPLPLFYTNGELKALQVCTAPPLHSPARSLHWDRH